MSNGLTSVAAALLLITGAGAALLAVTGTAHAAEPPPGGEGPEIRRERVEQAQEAEAKAEKEREAEEQVKANVPGDPAPRRIARRLMAQQDAWNRGDIDAFMTGYWKSDELRFASGNTVTKGWQATLDRYKKRYDSREKMGKLTFSDLDINVLCRDAALAFGRWKIERNGETPNGLFTLLFRKIDGEWVIVHDHTSSE